MSFFIKKNNIAFSSSQLKEYIFPDAEDTEIVNLYLSYLISKLGYIKADITIEESEGSYKLQKI